MKIAVIIVRLLVGLMFLFASITYFFNLIPVPEMTGKMKLFNEGLAASGYIMPVVKTFELLCGIAFVSGRFVALAVVVIFPIAVNILLVHAFLAPEGLPIAAPLFLGILFLAYAYRESYKPLLAAK
jgi:putative oxidoreductase